jgi:hypothetical protein
MTQSFDIMHLRSGVTMHDSDSNISSRGPFNEAAFDRFASHAKNGYMDQAAFATAIADDTHGDMRAQNPVTALTFGQNAVLAEYPVLLKLFNSTDPSGKPAIKVDDLKAFWKDGKLPDRAAPQGSVDLLSSAKGYATMLMKVEPKLFADTLNSIATATGLAHDGARLSTSKDSPKATESAGLGAGKAVKCPYLSGAIPMQPQLPANIDGHIK